MLHHYFQLLALCCAAKIATSLSLSRRGFFKAAEGAAAAVAGATVFDPSPALAIVDGQAVTYSEAADVRTH